MTAPDIRVERYNKSPWSRQPPALDTFAPVDDEKLAAEIVRRVSLSGLGERTQAITELIEAVREADSDQSCGCM